MEKTSNTTWANVRRVARRLGGISTSMLGIGGLVAADAPSSAFTRPPVNIVQEFVLECTPGDTPLATPITEKPDHVSFNLGCMTPAGEIEDIVSLRTDNTRPLGPGDHVLRLSMTSAEGAPAPSTSLTFPSSGGLSFIILTARCAQEGVSFQLEPNPAVIPIPEPTIPNG